MKIIKDFFSFIRSYDNYQVIGTLKEIEKDKLSAFDSDILDKIYNKSLEKLTSEMLKWGVSDEYVRWAKMWMYHMKSHFREYSKNKYKK